MNLLFLSVTSTVLCMIVAFILKYLSLLHWVTGHAYVLSKRRKNLSVLEMLDLFKNVKPFPISCQKGWKIDSYVHGHRVWFNFLTFPHNLNAPSIKVYAVFNRVQSTSQAVLQVLKNISRSSEWKPGVISAASTYTLPSSEVPSSTHGSPSVHVDSVKEEILSYSKSRFGLLRHDAWFTENVVPTETLEYKRFWHKEDNGVCWLLQMNEKSQTSEFYLIQPVLDVDQCVVSVVTWCREHSPLSVDKASILLSSLSDYLSLRGLQITPLVVMTVPKDLPKSVIESVRGELESIGQNTAVLTKGHTAGKNRQSSDSSNKNTPSGNRKADLDKYSSILKYGFRNGKHFASTSAPSGARASAAMSSDISASDTVLAAEGQSYSNLDKSEDVNRSALVRSVSDGLAVSQSRIMEREATENLDENVVRTTQEGKASCPLESGENISETDIDIARFKITDNQSAFDLLSEIKRASEIDLELSSGQQADSSGGWQFSSFEKNIVVLKKVQRHGITIQSYIGKGFVLAPPKAVWNAVRNPRIRFTYDETLKKVDIIATIGDTLKIVYFYHESLQFLRKESCDMCVLQGERKDGQKYVLTYSSIEHEACPVKPNITRAKILGSGWVIEPARQDNRVYSVVTYLMQIDFGHYSDASDSDSLPFQEMISHYPLSIADLQQYLKPVVQMFRQKSMF